MGVAETEADAMGLNGHALFSFTVTSVLKAAKEICVVVLTECVFELCRSGGQLAAQVS